MFFSKKKDGKLQNFHATDVKLFSHDDCAVGISIKTKENHNYNLKFDRDGAATMCLLIMQKLGHIK